jgi:kynurenine formamidase
MNKYLDLSHTIDETTTVWPGTTPFHRELRLDYLSDGCRVFDYHSTQGLGTHIDAPSHFINGARSIHQLTLQELISPTCVIDIREQVSRDPDYVLTRDDVLRWESVQGKITVGHIVIIFTGWSQYWQDANKYFNADAQGISHFPGVDVSAAELFVQREIVGLGIDTASVDCGSTQNYPVHHVLLGNSLYHIENLTNLELLPSRGATLFALPTKVKDGPEASARVVAVLPT